MQTIFMVLSDAGDGSNSIEYFRNIDSLLKFQDGNLPNRYQSGDGLQYTKFTFPDDLDLEACGFKFIEDEWDGEEY